MAIEGERGNGRLEMTEKANSVASQGESVFRRRNINIVGFYTFFYIKVA
jgi:hypothetical protein